MTNFDLVTIAACEDNATDFVSTVHLAMFCLLPQIIELHDRHLPMLTERNLLVGQAKEHAHHQPESHRHAIDFRI